MTLADRITTARGDAPADLVLRGARLVNVVSADVHEADITVADGRVVGLGPAAHREARETLDLDGAFVAPGFLDAHVHIESTLLTPPELGRLLLPRGTTAIVSDPHEVGNVLGAAGVRYMLEAGRRAPIDVFLTVPSCVPATHMETAGAAIGADDIRALLAEDGVAGLAEVMNYPGVVAGAPDVLAKLEAARGRVLDGHAPGLSGPALDAYVAAGIRSDHECTTAAEAREKLRRGMHIMIREGSVARNLDALLPLVTPANADRFMLVTDDITPVDLIEHGHIDHLLRRAIAAGVDPVIAVRMATLNPARYFGFDERGAVAPGYRADLVVFDDLERPTPRRVYRAGRLAAEDGRVLAAPEATPAPDAVRGTMNVAAFGPAAFRIPAAGRRARVIGIVPGQIVTEARVREPTVRDGAVVADPDRDLLKLAVLERHRAGGRIGRGLVEGLGLARGAIAGSVAHDHHNLIVAGASDAAMHAAARAVIEMDGGLAVADGEAITARLPLPVAGLMADRPGKEVADGLREVTRAAHGLGCPLDDPFMALSFLGLEVIPELKLTDHGLVDVGRFEVVALFVE